MTRLETYYKNEVVPKLMQRFGYKNVMQVPRLSKITLNMGVGEAVGNKKILENAVADMTKIAGQKPVVTKARVSVASFKIRDGWPIGSCLLFSSTAALPSKRISDPSARRTPLRVRTTTAS